MGYEKTEVPLCDGFYTLDSVPISHQECTNLYPMITELASYTKKALLGTPGLEQVLTTGSAAADANRGAWDMAGVPYFVNGTSLYKVEMSIISGEESWSYTNLGTISGTGRVSMADNGTQLMILVPGGNGYIYTVSGGLVQITDADFDDNGDPQYVVFIDGYFACSTDTKAWIISDLNDGTSWDSLDFGSAESDPDAIVAPIVYGNQIYLTGVETTETFQNIGGAGFPFQRGNQFFDKGCYAPASLVNSNERFFMIGGGHNESPAIWMFYKGAFTKVSTIAIDDALSSYSDANISSAFAIAYGMRSQYFVAFVFTDTAFVYNITTGLWHEQKSSIEDSNGDLEQTRWRVNSLVTAYGYTLVGDSQDGRIGKLLIDEYREYETNIIRVFAVQPLSNLGRSFRLPVIELTMEAGVGNTLAPDPKVSLAISKDSKLFNYERTRRIGRIGKYEQRTIWRKNGRVSRMAIMKFRISDPIKPVVIKLEVGIS
jgi:hypothetical protein